MSTHLSLTTKTEFTSGRAAASEVKGRVIRVMIVDEHAVVRAGVAAIASTATDVEVVAEAADGARALELFRRLRPDVILTEISLRGMGGVELTAAVMKESPSTRVIVFTGRAGREDIYRALQVGARSYLLKDASGDSLLDAIRAVAAGHRLLSDEIASRLAERVSGSQLTSRELEVLRHVAAGRSNKQIAVVLSISESTVKGHIKNILSKMNVSDRTQAVTTALRHGLIRLE